MRRAHRLMLPLLVVLLPGCAFFNEMACRSHGERAGIYLGQRYAGEHCTTTTSTSRDRRHTERHTRCTPTYRDVWHWNANSDRVYAACMAANAPQPARPAAVAVPEAEPVR